jgi:hypothetical protein
MSRRRVLTLVLAATALIVSLKIAHEMFWMPAIPSHWGDGTFQNISRRAGPFALPGYSISMPDIDLAEPHQAEYRFGELPNVGWDCGVYLAIHDPDGRWLTDANCLDGKLKLALFDSRGQIVVSVSGRLGDYTWFGLGDTHALYKLHGSFFSPDSWRDTRASCIFVALAVSEPGQTRKRARGLQETSRAACKRVVLPASFTHAVAFCAILGDRMALRE